MTVNELYLVIIENDADVRYAIKRCLPDSGFSFIEAASIQEAKEIALSQPVDIFICDKQSYYESDPAEAHEFLSRARFGAMLIQPEFSKVPQSILTAAGFTAFLSKPFTAHSFRQTIETLIQTKLNESNQSGKRQKWLRLIFDDLKASTPKVSTLPHGKLKVSLAAEEIFDIMFDEIARRQPLPEDIDAFDIIEMHLIKRSLETCKGNQSKAAKFLGITRNTLRKRIKKYGFATFETDNE